MDAAVAEARREKEEKRKEKHRKMEEERERMRQDIRNKVTAKCFVIARRFCYKSLFNDTVQNFKLGHSAILPETVLF